MDCLLLAIEIIAPLLIALGVLWVDRRMRGNDEFDSIMDGLIGELCQNLAIVRTEIKAIETDIDLMKKGGWSPSSQPLLSNDAYRRAVVSEVFFRKMRSDKRTFIRDLMNHYTAQRLLMST